MNKYFYPKDIRRADRRAIEEFGKSSLDLMECAGKNAAEIVLERFPTKDSVLVLCGPGNNGGDGFVLAKHLLHANKRVYVLTSLLTESYKGDANSKLQELIKLDARGFVLKNSPNLSDEEIIKLYGNASITIDALLGTGTAGPPRGEVLRLIKLLSSNQKTVSLDIPTGIDPFTGNVSPNSIKAELTITFLASKSGMSILPARKMCGEILTADIGIQKNKVLKNVEFLSTHTRKDLKSLIPQVNRDIHKGNRAAVLVIGGSYNYRGAPILSALAALRSGAGLVVLAIPDFMIESASSLLPEAIFVPLETRGGMIISNRVPDVLSSWLNKSDVVVFGPGIGRYPAVEELLGWFWNNWPNPLLVDADALSYLQAGRLKYRKNTIITPHSGEAAHILNSSVGDVNNSRILSSLKLAKISDVSVLKGMDTIISKKQSLRVIREGSPCLAVPGSGDVLNGTIATFCKVKESLLDAVLTGTLIHSLAGAELEKKKGIHGVLAREIANELQNVINQ